MNTTQVKPADHHQTIPHCHHPIALVAINARFSHASYSLRTLKANLKKLAPQVLILESDIKTTPLQLAERIISTQPQIIGFSAYLWNIRLIESCARIIRLINPNLKLILGGPELTPDYPHTNLFDALIIGEGESALYQLCRQWLDTPSQDHTASSAPLMIISPPEDTSQLLMPDHLYTDHDLAHRTIYMECSRGCPYNCTYCTHASTGLRVIPLDSIIPALERLWQRGLRQFKFLDRSFNAPANHACAILEFFLPKATPEMELHLEINPDHLDPKVASAIASFPKRMLHLEVGIQTLNPLVATAISRSPDIATTVRNLEFLTRQTDATIHADLIFGLPGETLDSFATGFNTIVNRCAPPELQVNLLKGLPGTRVVAQSTEFGLCFNPEPPYELLYSNSMDFDTLLQLQRFARAWELIHNRGRFPHTCAVLIQLAVGYPFDTFNRLANHIYQEEGRLHAISLNRLAQLVESYVTANKLLPESEIRRLLHNDLNAKPYES